MCKTVYDTVLENKCEMVNITVPQRECDIKEEMVKDRVCKQENVITMVPVCVTVIDKQVEEVRSTML